MRVVKKPNGDNHDDDDDEDDDEDEDDSLDDVDLKLQVCYCCRRVSVCSSPKSYGTMPAAGRDGEWMIGHSISHNPQLYRPTLLATVGSTQTRRSGRRSTRGEGGWKASAQ